MFCDAHVHIGYYSRRGLCVPFYYSPRRVFSVLDRCGTDEFIVSSTCAQVGEIGIKDIVREAREMKRVAGRRAHIFFWLSRHLYDENPRMEWLGSGLFEGIKLHEGETPWMQKWRKDLHEILIIAGTHDLPVMVHAGLNDWCRPLEIAKIVRRYPTVRFCLAHCRPMGEMANVIADFPNVWTDTAYMAVEDFPRLQDYDWRERLMFGTDLPVWQSLDKISLTRRYREYVQAFQATGLSESSNKSFGDYVRPSIA